MTHKSQRTEPFYKWLEDLNSLLEICLKELNFFFLKNDSKNWFSEKNKNRETFFDDSKNWTTFLKHDSKNRTTFFFEYDPKNRLFWKYVQRTFFQ